MKVLIIVFCAIVCLAPHVVSAGSYRSSEEKSFSLIGSFAGGFGIGGYYQGALITYSGGAISDRTDQYINYGEGIKLEGGAQYRLMDHLDCQAVLGYTWGVPVIKTTFDITEAANDEIKTYSKSLFGIKALVLPRVQVLDLIDVYAGFGFGLYFGWLSWKRPSSAYKGEYKTNPAFGFCGSLGAEYPIMTGFIAYGEMGIEQMNFTVSRGRTTLSGDETVYDQNSTATNAIPPPKIPGSNVALRIGVRFPIF